MIRTDTYIYLDYSATTPLDPEVAEVVEYHMHQTYGNASSVHAFGRSAKVVLEESRETIAALINAEPSEVFFTSGGTESDNHAIVGTALARRREQGKRNIAISAVEHHAVIDCAEYLKTNGFDVTPIPVHADGIVDVEALSEALTAQTSLVAVMHANNETGTLQPIRRIAEIAHSRGVVVHSDTVQTIGKIPVDVKQLDVDLLAISSHKIYGPKGIGAIFIRKETAVDPLLHGGSQERKNRAGTENIPLIAGFAKALELAEKNREQFYRHAQQCKSVMLSGLKSDMEGILINGDPETTLPHILNVSLDSSRYDIEGETLLLRMDLNGIAVSSGSACTSGSIQPSHVLTAMGRDERTTRTAIRFSFGKCTTIGEVEHAVRIFRSIVEPFRK